MKSIRKRTWGTILFPHDIIHLMWSPIHTGLALHRQIKHFHYSHLPHPLTIPLIHSTRQHETSTQTHGLLSLTTSTLLWPCFHSQHSLPQSNHCCLIPSPPKGVTMNVHAMSDAILNTSAVDSDSAGPVQMTMGRTNERLLFNGCDRPDKQNNSQVSRD